MSVREIRLHDDLWETATPLRRQEWRTLIADLLDAEDIAPHAERIVVAADGNSIRIRLHKAGATEELVLPEHVLVPHIEEYIAIVRKMVEQDIPAARIEALDMAKKVVHDRAARALASHAPLLARGHEAFRRLFSLLVALRVDTTNLPAAHRHAQI